MTLGFSTKIKNKPTYFVEKIWAGLSFNTLYESIGLEQTKKENQKFFYAKEGATPLMNKKYPSYSGTMGKLPKLHTIREDKKNLWKAGNNIHFVINNRTKNRFQFAPILKCTSTQTIEIRYTHPNNPNFSPYVFVDDNIQDTEEVYKLAINDGFDSLESFFSWFNKDFTGKIIHWTNLKY